MKKKILSIVLAVLLAISIQISAFASNGFDLSVFDGNKDIKIVKHSDNSVSITLKSLDKSDNLRSSNGAVFSVIPEIRADDNSQPFYINISYYGVDYGNIDGFSFIIDGTTYEIHSLIGEKGKTRAYGNVKSMYVEKQCYLVTYDTIQFMTDLEKNLDKDVKIHVNGDKDYTFSLTDEQKLGICNLFDLYIAAGGTRDSNLNKLTNLLSFKLITMNIK